MLDVTLTLSREQWLL